MSDYLLRKHSVKTASFIENTEKEKKNNFEVGVAGNILIPKDKRKHGNITIQLKFHLGNEKERLHLTMETVSVFEMENKNRAVSEEDVQKDCLPLALANLRKTVKMVTEAYGLPGLDLPPFEEEYEQANLC